ncbi:uncharacterized protein LOC135472268 isoform X2 [Liolophura sinensis]
MSILKQPNENVTFTLLRPANSGQRLRISVNTSRRKDVSWYSSGLDSTSDTTDSDTEGSLTNSEEESSDRSAELSVNNLENYHQPELNEVFSHRQFKIAYAEPTLGSHLTPISTTSVGSETPTSKREVHPFYTHGLPESLKMTDSSAEKIERHDAAVIVQPSDLDWLDSLNNVKSNAQTADQSNAQTVDQSSVRITSQTAVSSNDNGPLLDFCDDLVNIEPQGTKQSVSMSNSQLPPPAEFADMSHHASGEMSNQNGHGDIWESAFCETEFITEADNDVPVTNIDDLLEKTQGINHQTSPSEGDSGLFSESSASENLLDFERIQTPAVAHERLFYQPPQENTSGYKQGSDLGDLSGANTESEVEQILSGRVVGATDGDEEESLSTFSSHSGSTVIHRTGSAYEEVEDSNKDVMKDESEPQDMKTDSTSSHPDDVKHSCLDHAPSNEEIITLSVTESETCAPDQNFQANLDGEAVSLYTGESVNDRESPLPCEPCIVEEHMVTAQQSQQREGVSLEDSEPASCVEDYITPIHAPRDIVINLEGASDVQIPPRSLPDKTVLPELVDSLVEVCNADDGKASLKQEEETMSVSVQEELIIPSDKAKELKAEMSPTLQQTCANHGSAEQNVSVVQVSAFIEQTQKYDSEDAAKFSVPSKQENERNSEVIIPVKAPRRSPPVSSKVDDMEHELLKKEAMPNLVDSLVQNLDEKEKNDEFLKSGQIQTGTAAAEEESIIPVQALRESGSVVAEENETKDNQSSTDLTLTVDEELVTPTSGVNDNVGERSNKGDAIDDKAQLRNSNLMFNRPEPSHSKRSDMEVSNKDQTNKSRKSRRDDPDVIVPVKVPRRPDATDSIAADMTVSGQPKDEVFPKLVDSLVQHLEGNGQSRVVNSAEQTGVLVQEDNIVPLAVPRESASPPVDEMFLNEVEDDDVQTTNVCDVMIDISASSELVKPDDSSVALNGHHESANSFVSPQSFNPSSTSLISSQQESSETPNLANNQTNGMKNQGHLENILPVKASRRSPDTKNTEIEKAEKVNSQPFVDQLVTQLESADKHFTTKLEITEPAVVIKEDTIVPVTKPMEQARETPSLNDRGIEAHALSSDIKIIPVVVKSVDVKTEKSPAETNTDTPSLSTSDGITGEKSDEVRPEPLKPKNIEESLRESPKEENLITSTESNSGVSRNSSTLPPALAPVTVADHSVSRRLPSIKAFTARGFTPIKLNSLGSSSVIKTVSLDRSKINRLSGANIQPAPVPSFKLAEINKRSETGPFQIDLLSGILGLGIKVTRKPDGFYRISDIQRNSPVEKSGHIRVGDYLLSVNGTEITGLPDTKVQQILRLLPRGIIKLVVSTKPVEKEKTEQESSESFSNDNLKPQERFDESSGQKEFQSEVSWSARHKANSFSSLSAGKESLDSADGSISTSYLRAGEKETSAAVQNSVPKINIPREGSDSASKLEGTFSIRKVEIVDPECGSTSPKKMVPPPVMPRRRGRSSDELSLNVDIAQKEAIEQQPKEQESEGSVEVKAFPVMVRPSASPRTSITSPKGPPPPVMPRTRPRSQTSESDSPRSLSFESCSPLQSPRTPDTKDVLESNRKPSSVAKQFGTVKSPMSRKMSGLIDKFQHEEVSPVSPESDKVFSPRMSFENSNSGNDLRKHFSFSVSEEPKPEMKAEMSPKPPPKVAPKPKRKSGEIKCSQSEPQSPSSTESGSKEPPGEKEIETEKKSALFALTSKENKHDKSSNSGVKLTTRPHSVESGLKLTTRPHSVETVFNTRSLMSTSSLTRLKGLQIPSKPVEPADVNHPSSTSQVNPSKLAPALRPRSGPAAFTRTQPKIHQVSPKLNLMPIKLRTDSNDSSNKPVEKVECANPPHVIDFQDKPSGNQAILTDGETLSVSATYHQNVETEARSSAVLSQSESVIKTDKNKEDKPPEGVKELSLVIDTKPADDSKKLHEDCKRIPQKSLHGAISPEAKIVDDSKALKDSVQDSTEMNISLNDSRERVDVDRIETPCSFIVSESDESKNSNLNNKEQVVSSSEHPEIPVFEKFAEAVSSDVIDSSLLTASNLMDGQATEPNEPDKVSLDSVPIENKPEREVVEARLVADDGPLPDSQNSAATISVEVDMSNTEPSFALKTNSLLETIATDVPSDGNDSSSEHDSIIPLKRSEDDNTTVLVEGSQSPVMVLPSETNNVVIEAGNLVLNSKTDTAIGDGVSQEGLHLSSSKSTNDKENVEKPGKLKNGSVMVSSTVEPDTQTLSSMTNDEDSDFPPSFPSSAPPPLPSSPPPDLVTDLGSPPLHAEPSVISSSEPRPPLALRRHQDAVHTTSLQIADYSNVNNSPTSPSNVSLSIGAVSKEEPLTTDVSLEFQDEDLVASTPYEDDKSLIDTIQPSFPENGTGTMQSTKTPGADVDSLSKKHNTTVCVPSDVSTSAGKDKSNHDRESTDKTITAAVAVSPDISGVQIDQSNEYIVQKSQTAPTAVTLSSDISPIPPAEQSTGHTVQGSETAAPVVSMSPDTSLIPQTKEGNGHVDQTRQNISPTVTASSEISRHPVTDQNNGHIVQASQFSTNTAASSNRRKVTVISKRPEQSGALFSSDKPFLPPDELSSLLNKANETMEKTGANDDEIVLVVLHKDIGEKVGLSFKHGLKNEILISDIEKNSTAGKDGHIEINDQLLMVNGKTVEGRSPHDARVMLRTSREQLVLVLARSSGESHPTKEETQGHMEDTNPKTQETTRLRRNHVRAEGKDLVSTDLPRRVSPEKATSPSPERNTVRSRAVRSSVSPEKTAVTGVERDPSTMETIEVTMSKGVTGLGFCLEGGTGSPLGDKPILIKRLFKGGAADKCGLLREKDEILEVNGKSFQGLRHYEAWNYLKFLPSGDVKMIIRR